ncbi:MAG: DUF2868 domain-containing protein [Gemmatimonadota bacterium]
MSGSTRAPDVDGRSAGDEPSVRPSLDERLLAEAVRALERDGGEPLVERNANQAAVQSRADFESRITIRARHLSSAPELERGLERLRSGTAWTVAFVLVLAFVLGAGAARAASVPVDGSRVNFYWVLGGVLGVQTLLLLSWTAGAVLWGIRRREEGGGSPMLVSLGGLVVTVSRWVTQKAGAGGPNRAVAEAAGRVLGTGRIGFWTFSSVTHAVWLVFNLGALALILLLLSARQYDFVWETTILDERHYVVMTEALSAPVGMVGFAVPTAADIAESQWTGASVPTRAPAGNEPTEGRSQRWASLLVASILLYGAGPRLLLLGASLAMRRRACRTFRLDTTLPEYERLRADLMPASRPLGVVDPDEGDVAPAGQVSTVGTPRSTGPPAIVGLEIARPGSGWPPALDGAGLQNLGIIESREDRARVLHALGSAETEPGPLVIVCELSTTPDRGIARTLEALRGTVTTSPLLLLTAGQALRERGYEAGQVERRLESWREVAVQAGVDGASILAVDLDHLTDAAAARLAERLEEGTNAGEVSGRDLEAAFAVIERHAAKWEARDGPLAERRTESNQLALHRDIASLYRTKARPANPLFLLAPKGSRPALADVKSGVDRFMGLLPPRLRAKPRWLAAGAVAGAVGCLATSALLSPVALAALPTWAGIGAVLAAALQRPDVEADPSTVLGGSGDLADMVRPAALFAVVLELQGRDEASITRVLDGTFAEGVPDLEASMPDARAVANWLDHVRHRFDLALIREERA